MRDVTGDGSSEFTPFEASIFDIQAALTANWLTSRELVAWYLDRIEAYDQRGPGLNAISCLNEQAIAEADSLDIERRNHGPRGSLHGIPVVVKDNYDTRDMQTAAGSILLKGWIPDGDAALVTKLRAAGAIIIAKTNMHEWARGYLNTGSLFGQTRNPYALKFSPGGSSGGSGAAVAANFAAVGLGTDTAGSIRLPAAMNSLVGLRGTPGLLSRMGIIPMSHTQDIGGPLARSVADLAVVLDALVGYDPADPTTAESVGHVPPIYTAFLDEAALVGARIGVLTTLVRLDPFDEEVAGAIALTAEEMRRHGAELVDVAIPNLPELVAAQFVSVIQDEMRPDLDAYLATHPTAPVRTLEEIVSSGKCIPQVQSVLARSLAVDEYTREYYERLAHRSVLRLAVLFEMADHRLDARLYPTSRIKAPTIEATAPYNVTLAPNAGLPAISVPAGFTSAGMPFGVELLGRAWSEPRLIALAYSYEQATHHRRAPTATPSLPASSA